MSDYIAYNAEDRESGTPYEEMHPYENYVISVQTAQQMAHDAGVVFVNGPGLHYMEDQPDRGEALYKQAAIYTDILFVQTQGFTTIGQTSEHATPDEYRTSVKQVADWIHAGNPAAKIWVQVILSGGVLAENPLTAAEVVAFAHAVEDFVDNMRIYLADGSGQIPTENITKLGEILTLLRGPLPTP